MKNLKKIIGIVVMVIIITSCSSDSSSSKNIMRIIAKGTYTNPTGNKSANGFVLNSNVVLTSFKINIKEIEFKLAESDGDDDNDNGDDDSNGDDNNDGVYNDDDEIGLSGPWELDLLNQTSPVTTVSIANGTYEEVEFKLNKSLVSSSPMFNKTIEIRGTINGTPFVFWHDFEEDFEIDYEDNSQSLVVSNGSFDLVLNIDLDQVLSQVDLSTAVDGDGDGLIEIGPNDTDGNNALAQQLNDYIEDSTDIEDDED